MRLRKETKLNNGQLGASDQRHSWHKTLATAVRDYLEEVRPGKKPKTLAACAIALGILPQVARRRIDRKDLLKLAHLSSARKEGAGTTKRL